MEEARKQAEALLDGLDIKVLVQLRDILTNDEMYSILIDDYDNSGSQEESIDFMG